MDQSELYRGHRILIRSITEEDLPLLHSWLADPVYRMAWPWMHRALPSIESRIARARALAALQPPIEIEALVLHLSSETPIGSISLSAIDRLNGKAELSLGFVRGLGTRCVWEALHFALDRAFREIELSKLIFHVLPDNERALTLISQLAFTFEGRLREEILLDNEHRTDLLRYSLLASEWNSGGLRQQLQRIAPLTS